MSTRTTSSMSAARWVAAAALGAFTWATFGSLSPGQVSAVLLLTVATLAARMGVSRVLRLPPAVPLGCVARVFRRVPWTAITDVGRLTVAAVRGGRDGGRSMGSYLSLAVHRTVDAAPVVAAQGSLVLGVCAAPNTVALEFRDDGRTLRVHRLVPAPPPHDPAWPL